MANAETLSIGDVTSAGSGRAGRDSAFTMALVAALLLHSSFFLTLLGAKPRIIGDEAGRADAINVSTITEDAFRDQFALDRSGAQPANPAPPAPPAQPAPPLKPSVSEAVEPVQPVEEPVTEPVPKAEPEPPPPEQEVTAKDEAAKPSEAETETRPEPAEAAKPDDAVREKKTDSKQSEKVQAPDVPASSTDATVEAIEKSLPGVLAVPDPATAQAAAAREKAPSQPSKTKRPKRQKQAALDLSTPAARFNASPGAGGGAAAFQRPPGITRSGLNDEFARRVIRALQETMPQLSNTRGRVTVRIFLTTNGNIEFVRVINRSNVSGLDQSVVFAAKQTNYPIPPSGSNEADRTFLVTYIYE